MNAFAKKQYNVTMFLHKNEYISSFPLAEFRSKAKELIEIEKEDTYNTHWSYRSAINDQTVIGKMEENKFFFWRSNGTYSGIFYPVFYTYFLERGDTTQLIIGSKFNKTAEIIFLVMFIPLAIMLLAFIFKPGATITGVLIKLVMSTVLFVIFTFLPFYSYFSIKQQTLESLEKHLHLKPTQNRKNR